MNKWIDFHSIFFHVIQSQIADHPCPAPLPMPIPVTKVECAASWFMGLVTREVVAMWCYLNETNRGWFYQGIEDTSIHRENLLDPRQHPVSIVSPMIHILIKSCKTRHTMYHCALSLDADVGWLLSHAAGMHVLEYTFPDIC
jgi:hypothetical protein